MNITTKFTVATEQGIEDLLMLTKTLAIEKFAAIADRNMIDHYINASFNERTLTGEVNSLINQWLVVYADGDPAGYARITSRGKRPMSLVGKRAIRIADFGLLAKYPETELRDALFERCLSVCKAYEGVWINEFAGNPLIEFFKSRRFVALAEPVLLDELPLDAVYLIA